MENIKIEFTRSELLDIAITLENEIENSINEINTLDPANMALIEWVERLRGMSEKIDKAINL